MPPLAVTSINPAASWRSRQPADKGFVFSFFERAIQKETKLAWKKNLPLKWQLSQTRFHTHQELQEGHSSSKIGHPLVTDFIHFAAFHGRKRCEIRRAKEPRSEREKKPSPEWDG
jgi:hypothetical protein